MSFTMPQPTFTASFITYYVRFLLFPQHIPCHCTFNHALIQNPIHYKQNFTHPSICRSNITSFMKSFHFLMEKHLGRSFPKLDLGLLSRLRQNLQGPFYKRNIYLFINLFARSQGRGKPAFFCGYQPTNLLVWSVHCFLKNLNLTTLRQAFYSLDCHRPHHLKIFYCASHIHASSWALKTCFSPFSFIFEDCQQAQYFLDSSTPESGCRVE